jgi:mannose-6-phosphate isomerase-like protein (cupin superfamily)
MNSLEEYINSGVLELYAMGVLPEEEKIEVERMMSEHPQISEELKKIDDTLAHYALAEVQPLNETLKAFTLATIDFSERIKNGEIPSAPPKLDKSSTPAFFNEWTERADMYMPDDTENLYAKIIGYTPELTTAIVWIKEYTPVEVHDNEHEVFLILEGTCEIWVENEGYSLRPGEVFTIPLHKRHEVKVTSTIPCKVILQRSAA